MRASEEDRHKPHAAFREARIEPIGVGFNVSRLVFFSFLVPFKNVKGSAGRAHWCEPLTSYHSYSIQIYRVLVETKLKDVSRHIVGSGDEGGWWVKPKIGIAIGVASHLFEELLRLRRQPSLALQQLQRNVATRIENASCFRSGLTILAIDMPELRENLPPCLRLTIEPGHHESLFRAFSGAHAADLGRLILCAG